MRSARDVLERAGVMCLGLAARAAGARAEDQGARRDALALFKYAQNGNDVTVIGPILAEESIAIVKTYFDKKVVGESNRCRIALHI